MKFKVPNEQGFKEVLWGDHQPGCAKCRDVDLDRTASLVGACAEGSVLLRDELVKRQAPAQAAKALAVREWAEKTGVFKLQ